MERRQKHRGRTQQASRPSARSLGKYRKRLPQPKMKLKIIANPTAGRFKNSRYIQKLRKYLRNRGVSNHIVFTRRPGDAVEAANKIMHEHYDAVVVCGGDGTLREAVAGMIGSDIPIGIIPMGTGNVVATDLGIPKDPFKACDLIIKGKTREIDVGKSGDTYFLVAAGAGYDSEVVAQVDLQIKSKVGRLAYIFSAFKLLMKYKPIRFRIESDIFTGKMRAIAVVIANSAHYGGYFKLKKEARIDDGLLDVIIIKGRNWYDIIRIFILVLFKSKLSSYDIFTFCTKKISLATEEGEVVFHNDSDVTGKLPQTFEVVEKGVSIFVPDGNRHSLFKPGR